MNPKYQKGDLVARQDNTHVVKSLTFKPIKQRVTSKPQPQFIQDSRSKWQRKQDGDRGDKEYNRYMEAKKTEKGLQTLNAFLEFTDYAGLATGAGSLVSKGLSKAGKTLLKKGAISRLRDTNRAKSAFQEYISPFGYQLFNNYDGKIPEVGRFIKGYVVQGKDAPKVPWHVRRMTIEPERTINRQEALRLYMGNPKPTDNLYLKNADGTYRYNPNRIPKENIDYQRQVFQEAGNGKSAQEYLTTTLNGPKGTRPGNAGGVTSNIDSNGNFIIDDTWDLNPLKRFKWLPKPIRNFEAGKLIGAKPFRVYDDQIGKNVVNTSLLDNSNSLDNFSKPATNTREALINTSAGRINASKFLSSKTVVDAAKRNKEMYERVSKRTIPETSYDMKVQHTFINDNSDFNTVTSKLSTNSPTSNINNIGGYYDSNTQTVRLRQTTSPSIAFHEFLHSGKYGDNPPAKWKLKYIMDKDKFKSSNSAKYYGNSGEAAVQSAQLGKSWGVKAGEPYPGDEKFEQLLFNNGISGAPYYFKKNTLKDRKRFWATLNGTFFGLSPLTINHNNEL